MSKIKFAVIGQGHIGKRHAEMVRRNPECELVAVCDVAPKEKLGLNDLKEKFYPSIDELLKAHPEVDVVNVCTPNGLHAEHSLKALEALLEARNRRRFQSLEDFLARVDIDPSDVKILIHART